jgi:hypothetical protein
MGSNIRIKMRGRPDFQGDKESVGDFARIGDWKSAMEGRRICNSGRLYSEKERN